MTAQRNKWGYLLFSNEFSISGDLAEPMLELSLEPSGKQLPVALIYRQP
jgi:hypothetical protein